MVRFAVRLAATLLLFLGLLAPLPQSAAAADPPSELRYACALKSNGLLRAVDDPSACTKKETAVTLSPDPVLLCVQPSGSTRYVTSFRNCKPPAQQLTVPNAAMPTYFCVATSTGVLRWVTDASQCTSTETARQISPPDDAPTLVSSVPADGDADLATSTVITVTFSEPVSAETGAFSLACDAVTQTFTQSGLPGEVATLIPTSALPEDASCTLTVTASLISDLDALDPPDHLPANRTVSFTTDAAPTVTATTPSDGATGVSADSTVTVTFSEPVDVSAASFELTCAASVVPFSLSGSGTTTITLTPDADLPPTSACGLTVVAANVHDSDAGDPPDVMVSDVTSSFTTLDPAPAVTAVTPADGATDVSAAATIDVTFSEPVTVTSDAFVLECPVGTATTVTVSPAGPASSYTLTPDASLPKGTTCTLTVVAAEVSDVDAVDPSHPAADHVSSFDVSANAAPTAVDLTPRAVAENEPVGTTVGSLSTTDPDAGDTFTYSLVSGTGDTDNALFSVDGTALTTAAVLDAEASGTRSVRVRSTDGAGATVEATFSITVTDVNEAPSAPTLGNQQVDENEPAATTVGTLASTDPDTGQTVSFTLVTDGCGATFPDAASFQVTGTTLATAASLNHEAKSSYTVCVRVTDSGSPALATDASFEITVGDVNDAPVAAADGTYSGVIGNTRATLQRPAGTGPNVALLGEVLLANDSDEDGDTLAAVAETVTSTGGGTATIYADGSFSYLPGGGDTDQDDSFTYQVSDGTATVSGTVTVHIGTEIVWYVDNSASATGADGRSTSPFTSLAPVNGASDADAPGATLSVRTGSGAYGGGLVLEANQKLVGEREALVVGGVTLFPAGTTTPTLTNASGNGLTLANDVDVRGVAITNASGDGINGTGVTTATVGTAGVPVAVSGSGADGVDLSGGTGVITLNTTITTSATRSVAIGSRSGGSVSLTQAITGKGVELTGNGGATIAFSGTLSLTTTSTPAFSVTGGGTVTATGSGSTLASTTGTALVVDATNIGAAHLTFRSVSAQGAVNGIRLNSTGSSGGLHVVGGGSTTQGGDASGGTIQGTSGPGVLLTNTAGVQLNNLSVLSVPTAAGIKGSGVNGFTFTNGRIDGSGLSGTDNASANLAFNTIQDAANLTGAVTVSNSVLRQAYGNGVDVYNRSGVISNLTLSGNLVESTTVLATSTGSGILVQALGSASTAAAITTGSIATNTVRNFPNGGGILLYGGNVAGVSAPATTFGSVGNPVVVTGNSVQGASTATPMNTQCVYLAMAGLGSGAVNVTNNGSVGTPLGNNRGNCISVNSSGAFTLTSQVTNNVVAPGAGQNGGAYGISGGTDNATVVGGTLNTASLTLNVDNNTVSTTKSSGIRFLANGSASLLMNLRNNNVGAPTDTGGNSGIRVDSGTDPSPTAVDTNVCLRISGNTTAGSLNSATGETAPGIGLRKQGTAATTNDFGIVGLSPSPATAGQTVTNVVAQNPASAVGSAGYGSAGVFIVSGDNFVSCTIPG